MIVSAPMNEEELRNLMYTAQLDEVPGPFSIRYPRGQGVMANLPDGSAGWKTPFKKLEPGKGRKIKDGKKVAILSIGHPGNLVTQAIADLKQHDIDPAHYDMRYVKPIDAEFKSYFLS